MEIFPIKIDIDIKYLVFERETSLETLLVGQIYHWYRVILAQKKLIGSFLNFARPCVPRASPVLLQYNKARQKKKTEYGRLISGGRQISLPFFLRIDLFIIPVLVLTSL